MAKQYQLEVTTVVHSKVKEKFSRDILKYLQQYLPQKATVVEVGPGAGHFAKECIKQGHEFTAIEASIAIQGQLTKLGVKYIDATIPPIPLDDECADLFYASMVLEHMPTYTEVIEFVEDAKRIIRPNGLICLIFPNAYACGKTFWEMDYTHSYFTTPRRVTQLCSHLGLEVVEVQRVIGWFWVHSSFWHHILRHLSNIFAIVINASFVVWLAENMGFGESLWKLRKTFFEATIVIAHRMGA